MKRVFVNRFAAITLPAAFALLAACIVALIATPHHAAAQSSASRECRVLLMMDRSDSIDNNWPVMRTQVQNLFFALPASENVSLGYWTFSNVTNPGSTQNYNKPYHDYVSNGDSAGWASLMDTLPENKADILGGHTNYEQAFGYDNGQPNNRRPDDDPTDKMGVGNLQEMRDSADVLVLLTDGLPNYPVGSDSVPLDGNPTAVARGHAARETYAGKPVIGAYITSDPNPDLRALNATINGNENDQTNIGPLEFGDIESYLTEEIKKACNVPTSNYSLAPVTNVDGAAVQSGDTVNFSYSVNSDSPDGENGTTGWQLYDITIDPSVNGNPLNFTSAASACSTGSSTPYCNSINNCSVILNMIGGRGTCNSVPSGGRGTCGSNPSSSPGTGNNTFIPGVNNTWYSPPRCQTIEDLPLGTRVCSLLVLNRPTGSASIVNRGSSAECVTIGKTPLLQVHGGDIRVGKRFATDTSVISAIPGIYTSSFKVAGSAQPNGRTYGSWVEYGALAPGPIKRIASLSGYAGDNGGYDSPITPAGCDQGINKLTFSNTAADESGNASTHDPGCGYFAENQSLIPDIISTVSVRQPIDPSRYTLPLKFDSGSIAGVYRNDTTGATIEISGGTSEITKGKTYYVYVPNGTVFIKDNIELANDTYGNISELPQLVIIAQSIKIKDTVNRVDAWLVAPGARDNEGVVNTCVNDTGNTPKLTADVCDRPLTINGPVMARELLLWRTKVDKSDPACRIEVATDCKNVGDPAEIINLPASTTLWAQGNGTNPSRAQTGYTVELPPYY